MYEHDHGDVMSASALAQLLSTTLYGRRFFPFYAFNVVAGLDAKGDGVVYTYDAVGSYEQVNYAAQGAGQKLIIPLLDNLVGHRTRTDKAPELTAEEAVKIIKEAFITAGERDIFTGDSVEIIVMTAAGKQMEVFQLKED
jgi:20S proteasome subunit beta 6